MSAYTVTWHTYDGALPSTQSSVGWRVVGRTEWVEFAHLLNRLQLWVVGLAAFSIRVLYMPPELSLMLASVIWILTLILDSTFSRTRLL